MSDWKAEALVEFICDDVGPELFKMTCCDLTHWRLMDGFYWYFNNKGLSGQFPGLQRSPSIRQLSDGPDITTVLWD